MRNTKEIFCEILYFSRNPWVLVTHWTNVNIIFIYCTVTRTNSPSNTLKLYWYYIYIVYCSLVKWSWEYAGHILIIHLYTVLYPGSMVLGIRWNYIYITSIYCTVSRFNGPGNTLELYLYYIYLLYCSPVQWSWEYAGLLPVNISWIQWG